MLNTKTLTRLLITFTLLTAVASLFQGGRITEDMTLYKWESPYTIKQHIYVDKTATLTIEPGTELHFSPHIMLAVNGTVKARGTPTDRIVMTRDPVYGTSPPQWPDDIRLVDDRSVAYGRLQIKYHGKWRGVCANFVNWTSVDTTVACRQLGFQWGNFSFFPWARNDTLYMNYYKPMCTGSESSMLQCPGHQNIRIGSLVCLHQQTIFLRCYGLSDTNPARGNWWGMEFYNATIRIATEGSTKINESNSIFENVDIMYAGVDPAGQAVPAIRASPSVPFLINVNIKHCALDGTNFTDVMSSTVVNKSLFTNNRGHGLVVESHMGRVRITDSMFIENYGNGIKHKSLDGRFYIFDERETFCMRSGITGAQNYPLFFLGIPRSNMLGGGSYSCGQKFQTESLKRLTINFLEMDIEVMQSAYASAKIEVFDSQYEDYRYLIASYIVMNGTLPQSILSPRSYVYIKFSYTLTVYPCPTMRDCVKFALLLDAGPDVVPEFSMNNTMVHNNTQHGMYLENLRNYAYINSSDISHNNYGAGLRVYGGAGDVHVNSSRFAFNQDNAVNLTHEGGMRIFNMSQFIFNWGNGVNITINETMIDNRTIRYSRVQRTEIYKSNFTLNEGFGVRVSNCCRAGNIAVNFSYFRGNRRPAVELESCFKIVPPANATNMTIGYNTFDNNEDHAIKITPLLNAVGVIGNNTVINHRKYSILIDNTDEFLRSRVYMLMYVDYMIRGNRFTNNRGFYVVHVRLTQGSTVQYLKMYENRFTDNAVRGGFPTLNERTRSHAVVIVSSSNVNFTCNALVNPLSRYEVSTWLQDKNATLTSYRQWWGSTDYNDFYMRIFDQQYRYNLGYIVFAPAMSTPEPAALFECGRWDLITRPPDPLFLRGNNIGGKLDRPLSLPAGRYFVDRDINIIPDGELTVGPGTTFEFQNALGVLVQGRLDVQGDDKRPVVFKMFNATTYFNNTLARLVDGPGLYEGRLEVRPTEFHEWGTVCNEGWTMLDASVVCQMLGFVIHPLDWYDYTPHPSPDANQPIYRSAVTCTDFDNDIMQCAADGINDHTCNHTQDVYVRCKPPTWAGIHHVMSARPGFLKHAVITEAGLLDPSAIMYAPAIQLDYNVHVLQYLHVHNNMASGIEIFLNRPYSNPRIANSVISYNWGHGIKSRSGFVQIDKCEMSDNFLSGFDYTPGATMFELSQFRAGIDRKRALTISDTLTSIKVDWDESYRAFIITQPTIVSQTKTYFVEIYADSGYNVVMDYIDYNPDATQEQVIIYDGRRNLISSNTRRWLIEKNVLDFPIVSQTTHLTLEWRVLDQSSGRLAFVIQSRRWDKPWPFPYVQMRNSTTAGNKYGAVTRQYNEPSNEYFDLFRRYRWLYIDIYGVTFEDNDLEALYVPMETKYHDLFIPSFEQLLNQTEFSQIYYEVTSSSFVGNGGGLHMTPTMLQYASSFWVWKITNSVFSRNTGGGLIIELPKLNLLFTETFNHSIDVNDTTFESNTMFEFLIDGFYCNSSIARNRFYRNVCKKGCITIAGTEKDFELTNNDISENTGQYIVLLQMTSHTPYNRWVDATVSFNNVKRNMKLPTIDSAHPSSSPTTFAFGVKGLQNITLFRNLFSNSLDYEFIGGQSSSVLQNYLDIRQNYWGTSDQYTIQHRIFDFDDWNSFAIAEYYPFLIGDSFSAPLSTEGKLQPIIDLTQPIGGRIEKSLHFTTRSTPYVIKSDLTIMSTASLVIDAGVELQFYPNVGILVLGSLTCKGTPGNPVKLGPISKSDLNTTWNNEQRTLVFNTSSILKREKRTEHEHFKYDRYGNELANQLQLTGMHNNYEGYLEIYNTTERRWELVCDDYFNERTAEVACRTMGLESSDAIVRRDRNYDYWVLGYPKMHDQLVEWFWRYTFVCDGTENNLDQCTRKYNYNIYQCMDQRNYVFIRCGPRNLNKNYNFWGNIRFSTQQYEQADITAGFSFMEHTTIYGAGYLHGEKAAAIQAIYRVPSSQYVTISHSASNGYDFVSPRDEFSVMKNRIHNNYGYAVGGLVLNGDSRYDIPESSFIPLRESYIPYDIYGLVRMCTTEKLIYVKDRILLYYKYNFQDIDCIKIIRSKEPRKQIALRFLQLNLYNDSFYLNAIEMYNGEYFEPELMITRITVNSSLHDTSIKYETTKNFDTMGIRITASAAYGTFGFVAEVVTLPYSPTWRPDLGPGMKQRIQGNDMVSNEGGCIVFQNVGELNPSLIVEQNRMQRNGLALLNMTGPPLFGIYIQNSRLLTIANNFVGDSHGPIWVNTTTKILSNSIYANITNNVITRNSHGPSLFIEGHYFQGFDIRLNYISFNHADLGHDVIAIRGVSGNFTSNTVYNSTGRTILNVSVPEKVSILQKFVGNSIYDNQALANNKTTIFCGSAKHSFHQNFLQNRWNYYELVTFNRTIYEDNTYPILDATVNWWGGSTQAFVAGRIWERRDSDYLIQVNFDNFFTTNTTILQGKCQPGWRLISEKCYYYMGGTLPYNDAEYQCKKERAILAWARTLAEEKYLGEIISSSQINYNPYWRTWVYHEWQVEGLCTAMRDYRIEHVDCNTLLPFVCERDPYVNPEIYWIPIIIAVAITGSVLLLIVPVLLICACVKSKARKTEKVERREDLRASRASLRASRASLAASRQSLASIGKGLDDSSRSQKKRRPPLGPLDASAMSMDDSSYDPMEKKRLMMQESQALNNSRYGGGSTLTGGAGNGRPEYSTNYDDSDLSGNTDYRPQNVDNEIALMRTRAGSQTRFLDDNDQFDRYPNDLDTNGEAPIRMEELPKRPPLSYAQRYKNGNRQASSSSTTSSYNKQRDPFM